MGISLCALAVLRLNNPKIKSVWQTTACLSVNRLKQLIQKQFQSWEVQTYDYLQEYNMWVIKSRRTGNDTNTKLVKQVRQVQLHVW